MPGLSAAAKSKNKSRDARRSRSRNTTPSSVLSGGTAPAGPSITLFLELDTTKLIVPAHPQYGDIVDRLESKAAALDPKQLQDISDQLKQLGDSAEKRVASCEYSIRKLHEQAKEVEAEPKERDKQAEQTRRAKARKEAQPTEASQKNGKAKKRKDRVEGFDGVEVKHEGQLFKSLPSPFFLASPAHAAEEYRLPLAPDDIAITTSQHHQQSTSSTSPRSATPLLFCMDAKV